LYYYLAAIDILVTELGMNVRDAITKLRLPEEKSDALYNQYILIKKREKITLESLRNEKITTM
jgi:hypothetical protein